MNIRFLFLTFLTFLIVLTGCSKPITTSGLVPEYTSSYKFTDSTITVLPVVIRPQPKPGLVGPPHSMPGANQYREAIVETLQRTGLFSEVKTTGDSNYLLSTEVIAERLIGDVNNIGLFLIRYELTDTSSDRVILSENIFSYSMLSGKDIYAGHERAPKVIENSVRKNMTQLTTRISEALQSKNE